MPSIKVGGYVSRSLASSLADGQWGSTTRYGSMEWDESFNTLPSQAQINRYFHLDEGTNSDSALANTEV